MVSWKTQLERLEKSRAKGMIEQVTPNLSPLFGVVVRAAGVFEGIPTARA